MEAPAMKAICLHRLSYARIKRLTNWLVECLMEWLSNLILPPTCTYCQNSSVGHHNLCRKCKEDIVFCDNNTCTYCSLTLPPHPEEYTKFSKKFGKNVIVCDFCYDGKYKFDALICPTIYGEKISSMASALKFEGQTNNAKFFALEINKQIALKNLCKIDIIACVPISRRRLFFRGYNQASLIAKFIYLEQKKINPNVIFAPNLLQKIKHTKPQSKLSRIERIKNIKNCFSLNKAILPKINKDLNILLVDDIATTLATITEACKTLKTHFKTSKILACAFSRVDIM